MLFRSLKPEFLSTEGRELLTAWVRNPDEGLDQLDDWLEPKLMAVRSQAPPVMAEALIRAAFAQCVRRLEQQYVRRLKAMHRLRLDEMEEDGRILPMLNQHGPPPADGGDESAGYGELRSFENHELALNEQLLEL